MTKTAAPKRGRPTKYADQPRSAINFRISNKTRERLVEAAKQSGRSLSAEIEHCIEYALLAQKTIGDVEQYRRMSMKAIDAQAGKSPGRFLTEEEAKSFVTDEQLKAEIAALRKSIAESLMPPKPDDDEAA
jgi:hypothetical protein